MRTVAAGGLVAVLLLLAACSAPVASPSTSGPSASPTASGHPSASPSPSPTATPSAEQPTPSASVGGTTYTVQPGDGLMAIARAFDTTADQLVAWNVDRYPSLATDPNVLEPGWILVVSGDPDVTPRATPSPTPRATLPPTATGCTAGNRADTGAAETFRTIPDAGAEVALTFDMGGRMDPAVDILEFLVEHEVCATIFATGAMSQTAQGQAALAIVRDHPELFEMGNHTMYHCDLVRGGGGSPSSQPCVGGAPSADRIRQELTDAEAILRDATGQDPQPYWRPPYGSINDAVLGAAASVGYTKTFLWDIDSVDWKPISDGGPTAAQIASKVVGNAVNGSNVLFHLGGYETLDALELLVPALRDRGFVLTSLSDLLD
ncbi:MAG TPA: polysaccharide deacetylase family protein [Candidatus Limnocylindria bacterium]|nr:polysaccharide deacetylase family protein [Candidatus Limnocylindria bacterium]